jgi:AcrR family transcriptional regulator
VSERNLGGRPPRSSREAVVTAGLEILRSEGLPAVTLSAVGERLGIGKVGLYTYVASKDDLLLGMRDEVNRRQLEAIREERDLPPEVALKAICGRLVELMTDYGQLLIAVPAAVTDQDLEVGEHFLDILARLGLAPQQQLQVYMLLTSTLHSLVTGMLPSQLDGTARKVTEQGEALVRTDPEHFPRLTTLYADTAVLRGATPGQLVAELVSLIVDVVVPALRQPS